MLRLSILTLALLNPAFFFYENSKDPEQLATESQLIWIYTIFDVVREFIAMNTCRILAQ